MARKIGVLMGGLSAEREVSLRSGRAVCAALEYRGYDVVPIDVDREVARKVLEARIDLAFIALHGPLGEDGAIQGLLEVLGVPYTGSGILASALGMDKIATKKILAQAGLPVPEYRELEPGDAEGARAAVAELGLPVVVKAPTQGSSLGVYIVEREDDVGPRVADAAAYGDALVLVEKFIAGPELTAAVVGNRDPLVLPLIEITSVTGKYDYESKYTPGLSAHLIPPRVSQEIQARVSDLALRAYLALGCRGFARVDLIVSGEEAYILEINTIPGLTDVSLFPDAARAAGMSFADLVERLVHLAQEDT